jgi:hypothetical protein
MVCYEQHHYAMCSRGQHKHIPEGSIGQSTTSPRSSDVATDMVSNCIFRMYLFREHDKSDNMIALKVRNHVGLPYGGVCCSQLRAYQVSFPTGRRWLVAKAE